MWLQEYSPMKPNRLLNGRSLYLALLHTELGGRSDDHDVGSSKNSPMIINGWISLMLRMHGIIIIIMKQILHRFFLFFKFSCISIERQLYRIIGASKNKEFDLDFIRHQCTSDSIGSCLVVHVCECHVWTKVHLWC